MYHSSCFHSRNQTNLVIAFNMYVRHLLGYASVIWSPSYITDTIAIEHIQKDFTKCSPGCSHMPYPKVCSLFIQTSDMHGTEQWFPTCGPRAKSGPPSLKMWPAALDKLKKKKELNHRVFLTFNLFYLISIFDKHYATYSCTPVEKKRVLILA